MASLHTENLHIGYHYGKLHKVLQSNLDLKLASGRITTLIGQNGVGKSTFIRTLAGLQPSLSGQVYLNDKPLLNFSRKEIAAHIAMVLTDKPHTMSLTVEELVALGRHAYTGWLGGLSSSDRSIVDQAITQTNINYIAHTRLYELSDGQLQKAMIARALAQDTDILILDEPIAHLDLNNKLEILMMLQQIARQGKHILLTSHDLHLSLQLSDVVWLFRFNQPMCSGIPEDLAIDSAFTEALHLQGYGYDLLTGSLIAAHERAIRLSGEQGPRYDWTARALNRNGYALSDEAPLEIVVGNDDWNIVGKTFQSKAHSIEDTLNKLYNIGKR